MYHLVLQPSVFYAMALATRLTSGVELEDNVLHTSLQLHLSQYIIISSILWDSLIAISMLWGNR